MSLVACKNCLFFIPDQVGDGLGVGQCKQYEDYKAKNPSEQALKNALKQLGNIYGESIFWGGSLANRTCSKYQVRG